MSKRTKRAGALALAALAAAASSASAIVIQQAGLRISVLAQVIPYKLPRQGTAPIAVFVSGHLSSEDGGIPAQLERLVIEVNHHGLLQSKGLPVCRLPQIQPASSQKALRDCGRALVGSGRFWGNVILPGQAPYPTQGRLLIFNGKERGRPNLLAHIFTSTPFNTSFVIGFSIRHISDRPYGTELSASLPEALGEWGYLDRIKLTLRRRYRYRGRQLSYFNAACPAPPGATRTAFPLAHVSFFFAQHAPLAATVSKACGVRGS